MRAWLPILLILVPGGAGVLAQDTAPLVRINTPYVQTPHEVVLAMLNMAGVNRDDLLFDLGCGDGRIVIAVAREFGARGVGIDIDPDRVREAREQAAAAGVSDRVEFRQQDLFDADFNGATVVAIYLLPEVNRELLPVLLHRLKPGTRIVSHAFGLGTWPPEKAAEINGCKIFLWIVPPANAAAGSQGNGK